MAISRVKVWINEILTSADLNAEFDNILDNGEDLGWPATKSRSMAGFELVLDADSDTSITADTDDQIDLKLGGTDIHSITTSGLHADASFVIAQQVWG
jgi:hypothetical protein